MTGTASRGKRRRARRPRPAKTIIGWRENVALPDWDVPAIRAKVDTGARTSSIDVADLAELDGEWVRFDVVLQRRPSLLHRQIEARIVGRTRVRSSLGPPQDRVIVETTMRLGAVVKPVRLTLVSRDGLICRMLLGRRALEPEFVVDVAKRYVLGRQRRRKQS